MKILFYGNCQTEATMAALRIRNPDASFEYSGNSNRVKKYDPTRTNELMDWCDHIITQPVMKLSNPDHHEVLRARFKDKISFMPYIWVDGLFSLCAAPGAGAMLGNSGKAGVVGEELVAEHLAEHGTAQTLADFRAGKIDFKHRERFDSSLAELARREESADVGISGFIRDRYQTEEVMLTHNHPHPALINEIADQLARRLGLTYRPITRDDPLALSAITLPEFGKINSPYSVADLGIRTPYDLHWQKAGADLIMAIVAAQASTVQSRVSRVQDKAPRDSEPLSPRDVAKNERIAARRAARLAERAKPAA